jgi:succinate dehydrogenase / fumarate reductase cytochrome b subunit
VEIPSAPASTAVPEPSFLLRHQFVIYRLFSLAGLFPVGAYLVVHLATNASIINGPMTYQQQVDRIQALGVVLPLVEWVFIFIPLMFHAAVGWLIVAGALPNANTYTYASNIRYTLQRATGIIAMLFIVFHVVQLHHFFGAPFHDVNGVKFGAQFEPRHAATSAALALQPMWIKAIYVVGVLSVVYHFANGLWTQGITWGLWTSAAAQRRASWISAVVGVALTVVSLSALWGFWTIDIDKAAKIEDAMEAQRSSLLEIEPAPATNEPQKSREPG